MAEAVAGGDTKKLFKMMERGELDPNKALPIFFDLLGKKAEPFMEEYYKTLLYQRRRYAVAEEEWFKKFMGSGAEQGLTHLYGSFASALENAVGSAEFFGDLMYRASGALSLIPIMGRDLANWLSGEGRDIPNAFRDALGEMPALTNFFNLTEMEQLKTSFVNLIDTTSDLAKALVPATEAVIKFGSKLLGNTAREGTGVISGVIDKTSEMIGYVSGAISGDASSEAVKIAARVASEDLVDSILTTQGIDPTTYDWKDKKRYIDEVYPYVLEEVKKRRSEMGSFRGMLFDTIEGSPLTARYPQELKHYVNSILGGLVDVADIFNVLAGNEVGQVGGDTLIGKLRLWAKGSRLTSEQIDFLTRNPDALRGAIRVPTPKPFDSKAVSRAKGISLLNERVAERYQGFGVETPYEFSESGITPDEFFLYSRSPYKSLGQRSAPEFKIPIGNKTALERIASKAEGIVLENLPSNSAQGVLPILQNSGNRVENNISFQNTLNVEVSDMDSIVDQMTYQLEENQKELAIAISNKLGGGIV